MSAFSSWCSDNLWALEGGRGKNWVRTVASYNLISVSVGHYVNCTSRLQCLCYASSVLSWFLFGKKGGLFFISLFKQEMSTRYVLSAPFWFAFTLSH